MRYRRAVTVATLDAGLQPQPAQNRLASRLVNCDCCPNKGVTDGATLSLAMHRSMCMWPPEQTKKDWRNWCLHIGSTRERFARFRRHPVKRFMIEKGESECTEDITELLMMLISDTSMAAWSMRLFGGITYACRQTAAPDTYVDLKDPKKMVPCVVLTLTEVKQFRVSFCVVTRSAAAEVAHPFIGMFVLQIFALYLYAPMHM